jgi:hypothetical protein
LPTFLALCWWGDFSPIVTPSAGDVIVGGVKNTDQENLHETVQRNVNAHNPFLLYDFTHFSTRKSLLEWCAKKARSRAIEPKQRLGTRQSVGAVLSECQRIESCDYFLQPGRQV